MRLEEENSLNLNYIVVNLNVKGYNFNRNNFCRV